MSNDGTNGIDPTALVTVFSRRLSRYLQTSLCCHFVRYLPCACLRVSSQYMEIQIYY